MGVKVTSFYEETYLQYLFGPFKKGVLTHENSLHDGNVVPFTISSQTFVDMNRVYLVCVTSPC